MSGSQLVLLCSYVIAFAMYWFLNTKKPLLSNPVKIFITFLSVLIAVLFIGVFVDKNTMSYSAYGEIMLPMVIMQNAASYMPMSLLATFIAFIVFRKKKKQPTDLVTCKDIAEPGINPVNVLDTSVLETRVVKESEIKKHKIVPKINRKVLMAICLAFSSVAIIAIVAVSSQIFITKRVTKDCFVQFGNYLGEPILWQCIKVDENGPLLVSDRILCIKPYDAAEGGKGCDWPEWPEDDMTLMWGSHHWPSSNIRDWLNSAQEKVSFNTAPPNRNSVGGGYNAYDNEPGFLFNFSADEREKIKKVVRNGSADLVFILTKDELIEIWPTEKQRLKYPTIMAVRESDFANKGLSEEKCWYYWTSSPDLEASSSAFCICVNAYGFSSAIACGGMGKDSDDVFKGDQSGVVPALYLSADVVCKGVGTKDDPFLVK